MSTFAALKRFGFRLARSAGWRLLSLSMPQGAKESSEEKLPTQSIQPSMRKSGERYRMSGGKIIATKLGPTIVATTFATLLGLSSANVASAQSNDYKVCACTGYIWSAGGCISGCGGTPTGYEWKIPGPGLIVCPGKEYSTWALFEALPNTSLVLAAQNKTEGPTTMAECQAGELVTKETVLGSTPVPPDPPDPEPPNPNPPCKNFVTTWTEPTHNEDQSLLDQSTITGYRHEWTGAQPGNVIAPRGTTWTSPDLPDGNYAITLRTVVLGFLESKRTNPVNVTLDCPDPPQPPAVITVAYAAGVAQVPVYGVTASNTRSSTVVGVIDIGKPCTGGVIFTYRGQGYRRVTQSDVYWHQTTPTDSAAAPCVVQ